jgi:hypothetical protein
MYQLQVDDNSDFSSPELDVTRSETDYTPAGSLDIATHYWRVRAQNAADTWGEWSEVWFFEIEDSEPSSNERVYLPLILRK